MTNEAIDKLEGLELDEAFRGAFGYEPFRGSPSDPHERFDADLNTVIAALPKQWLWRTGTCLEQDVNYFATIWPRLDTVVTGFKEAISDESPATALCRAALKAKAKDSP
ncbi:MAG: hypothetical protein IID41_00555 [Planctomycetes bacterium]|nr:hypothetical protein [Planctomycetota bacterium]